MLTTKERLGKLWPAFHEYAWHYPAVPSITDQERAKSFYEQTFPQLIFCPDCHEHYMQMLQQTPIDVSSRDNLFHWTYDRHNEVSKRIAEESGIKKQLPSYDTVYEAYDKGHLPVRVHNETSPLLLFDELQKNMNFRERVMVVVIVMILLLLLLHRLLQRIATFIFCPS